MNAFVLAAGFGERLKPLTNSIPKPCIPLLNTPIIHYSLANLHNAKVQNVIVNLHYLPEQVKNTVNEYTDFFNNITYSYEPIILGTGGGLKNCEVLLNNNDFILINSDIVSDINLSSVIDFHNSNNSELTLVLCKHPNANKISPILIDVKNNIIDINHFLGTTEDSNLIYTGICICSPKIFDYLNVGFSHLAYTGFIGMMKDGLKVKAYVHDGFWSDIGNIKSYYDTTFTIKNDISHWKNLFKEELLKPDENTCDKHGSIINSIIPKKYIIKNIKTIKDSIILPESILDFNENIEHSIIFDNTFMKV